MTLKQYFAQRKTVGHEATEQGTTTEWMDFCHLDLQGPEFLIADASFLPSEEDGLLVKAPQGRYLLQVKAMEYGDDTRPSRLRAALLGTTPHLGAKLGETWTDTATTGICDLRRFSAAWGEDDESSLAKVEEAISAAENFGIVTIGAAAGAVAPFLQSGFGDGTFPVYELVEGDRRVGFEIEFIEDGAPYPFLAKDPTSDEQVAAPEQDRGTSMMSELFSRLENAFKGSGGSKTPSHKQEQKTKMLEVFKQFESDLFAEAEKATAEYREHLKTVRSKAPPAKMVFIRSTTSTLLTGPDAKQKVESLRTAGFVPIGEFEVVSGMKFKLAGFMNPDLRAYAMLASVRNTLNCEFVAEYADDTSLCVNTSVQFKWMLQPPWRRVLQIPAQSVEELLEVFKANLGDHERLPVSAESFERNLGPDADRSSLWRNDKGGYSTEELKALARLTQPALAEDPEWLANFRLESVDKALFNWLRAQEGLSFDPDAAMGSLLIIHDELEPETLSLAYWTGTSDFRAKTSLFAEGLPREAFARVVRERTTPLTKVATKATGLAADYYLPVGNPS